MQSACFEQEQVIMFGTALSSGLPGSLVRAPYLLTSIGSAKVCCGTLTFYDWVLTSPGDVLAPYIDIEHRQQPKALADRDTYHVWVSECRPLAPPRALLLALSHCSTPSIYSYSSEQTPLPPLNHHVEP